MKAMILAAGLGTRLRPLTENRPKALIPLNKTPLIYYIINKLRKTGISEIIINVHHRAQQIVDYIKSENNFGICIEISNETVLLDTGGSIKKAAWFFQDNQPFIVHNVDVLSEVDLDKMIQHHIQKKALATLAVRRRKSSRYLLFDEQDALIGWKSSKTQQTILSRAPRHRVEPRSFMGIHVISPQIFAKFPSHNIFSIIDAYLDISHHEGNIVAFHADSYFWLDLGRPENLIKAENYLKKSNLK
jgi:NDP-sugar pyrophosphorylase family protein